MPEKKARELRDMAAECRTLAHAAESDGVKQQQLELAAQFERFAVTASKRPKNGQEVPPAAFARKSFSEALAPLGEMVERVFYFH